MAMRRAKEAHDALLALKPEGAIHESCSLCPAVESQLAMDGGSHMPGDNERSYTAVEHTALLEAEVKRQSADLSTANANLESEKAAAVEKVSKLEADKASLETEKAELLSKVDKVEAEKAALETAKDQIAKEFEDFKANLTAQAEKAQLRTERLEKAKAQLTNVGDGYFADDRIDRWAAMAVEAFDAELAGLVEATGAATSGATATRQTAAFNTKGPEPTAGKPTVSTLGQLFMAKTAN